MKAYALIMGCDKCGKKVVAEIQPDKRSERINDIAEDDGLETVYLTNPLKRSGHLIDAGAGRFCLVCRDKIVEINAKMVQDIKELMGEA